MQRNKSRIFRGAALLTGAVFLILPLFFPENGFVYAASPWIYLTGFLYYSRTIEGKTDWLVFGAAILAAYEIRHVNFLGSEGSFDLTSALLAAILAAAMFLPFAADRFYFRNGRVLTGIFAFPVFRIVAERIIPGHQFNIGFTQFDNKWLIQSASFFGDAFVTFTVSLIPSVIVCMLLKRENRRVIRTGICVLGAFVLLLLAGAFRYRTGAAPENTIPMAYASGPQKTYYENPSETDVSYDESAAYLRRTVKEAADGGARLMAYAEQAFWLQPDEEEPFIKEAELAAKENDIFILLTLDMESEDNTCRNKAVLIDNNGSIRSEYLKTNLIPVLEDEYVKGDGTIPSNPVVIDGEERTVSYTICFDATFPSYLLSMSDDTDLFINPSWDWREIVDMNYRLQAVSTLEAGVVLFKPTVDGWSVVADPYGRILYKESTLATDYDEVHFADVPALRLTTVYERIHMVVRPLWWLFSIILILDMCRMMIKNRKMRKKSGRQSV